MDECVRRNPGTALLIAVGAGLAIGLLVRGLRPEPDARHRALRMFEDLECRLRDAAAPVLRRAGALASDGADALQDGLHSGDGLLRDARNRLRRLFS